MMEFEQMKFHLTIKDWTPSYDEILQFNEPFRVYVGEDEAASKIFRFVVLKDRSRPPDNKREPYYKIELSLSEVPHFILEDGGTEIKGAHEISFHYPGGLRHYKAKNQDVIFSRRDVPKHGITNLEIEVVNIALCRGGYEDNLTDNQKERRLLIHPPADGQWLNLTISITNLFANMKEVANKGGANAMEYLLPDDYKLCVKWRYEQKKSGETRYRSARNVIVNESFVEIKGIVDGVERRIRFRPS